MVTKSGADGEKRFGLHKIQLSSKLGISYTEGSLFTASSHSMRHGPNNFESETEICVDTRSEVIGDAEKTDEDVSFKSEEVS